MEDICEVCKKPVQVFCSCETSYLYCYQDFFGVHQKGKGKHNEIDLPTKRQEINQKFVSIIENLKKVKIEIISRSNELINIIQVITKSRLSCIEKYIDSCYNDFKNKGMDFDKINKDYQSIETREANIESFMKITAKNFSILKDDDEIIDPDHQKVFLELKLKSLKFSKNLEKIQKQLKTNLSLLLQGHTSPVRCVAETSDNKNVISGSYDNTIRIWNLLEKIQEAVLEGHTDSV